LKDSSFNLGQISDQGYNDHLHLRVNIHSKIESYYFLDFSYGCLVIKGMPDLDTRHGSQVYEKGLKKLFLCWLLLIP